ncbi:MAG: effector binding domain-containing protein [bacterium]
MNYYERVEKAIDYMENNLEWEVDIEDVAKEAYMSQRNFYRMFFALTGYTVKEYIRNRRFSNAAKEIQTGKRIIDIAIKYGFSSHEAFTRSFQKTTGILPGSLKKKEKSYKFERMSILDKYFDVQDKDLLEKYPDIKVLKELSPMRVAYYCAYGKGPEGKAWEVISDWLKNSGLDIEKDGLRFFGFNNPDPVEGEEEYGYEIWATIPNDFEVNDERISTKDFAGGLYAVTSVNGGIENIVSTWQRLHTWLSESKYTYGGQQWLEEHLDFDDDFNHLGGLDIYMPIEKKKIASNNKEFVDVEPMRLACYRAEGPDAVDDARKFFISWLAENGYLDSEKKSRVIAWYNHERIGQADHYCEIGFPVENDAEINNPNIHMIDFSGGQYALVKSKFKRLGYEWRVFMQWMQSNGEYQFGGHQFFEEYLIQEGGLEMESDVRLYMPIKK